VTEPITPVVRRRKKPVEVDTIQWTGDNETEVQAFTGGPSIFYALDEDDRAANGDDPDATAAVYDKLHSTWVLVYTGQHIVRGVKGEYYPIAEDVLAETYEPASNAMPMDRTTAALAEVRRLCNMTINDSIRSDAIDQARDTLAAIDRVMGDAETPLSPYYQHPACGFHWHGRHGMDIPMRDGQPICPRCEINRLHEKHKAGLRRADDMNNQLMQEVQRYAAGTEQPVLWSVYNAMHLRADNAEAAVKRVRQLHDQLAEETDLTSPDAPITRAAAAKRIAAALDGPNPTSAPQCDVEFENGARCAKPAGHRPPGSDDPHVPEPTSEAQPVPHAPGKATLCPDCLAKGHATCMPNEQLAAADTSDETRRTLRERHRAAWNALTPAEQDARIAALDDQPPAHKGGVADDCPACQTQGLHTINPPYECPGPETTTGEEA